MNVTNKATYENMTQRAEIPNIPRKEHISYSSYSFAAPFWDPVLMETSGNSHQSIVWFAEFQLQHCKAEYKRWVLRTDIIA